MNSFTTRRNPRPKIGKLSLLQAGPIDFLQNKVPKILPTRGTGVLACDPELEWCPPGHGDFTHPCSIRASWIPCWPRASGTPSSPIPTTSERRWTHACCGTCGQRIVLPHGGRRTHRRRPQGEAISLGEKALDACCSASPPNVRRRMRRPFRTFRGTSFQHQQPLDSPRPPRGGPPAEQARSRSR